MSMLLHCTIGNAIKKNLGPHLLLPSFRKQRPADATKSWGCCYVASEALYHLGARALGWKPAYVKIGKDITHWFLMKHGMIMDLTVDQFGGRPVPYKRARLCGFMTKAPSARTQRLMAAAETEWRGPGVQGHTCNATQSDADDFWMRRTKDLAGDSPNVHGRKTSVSFVDGLNRVVAYSTNDFLPGVDSTSDRLRPGRYQIYLEHSERRAIYAAARAGVSLAGTTAYTPWFPCVECARALVGVGVARMVCTQPDFSEPKYHFPEALEILKEAGVKVEFWKGENANN